VGANAFVGPKATLGPNTVVGDGAYIEGEALVERSVVGPDTYVGAMTEVRNSFAWGRQLLNLLNGSCIEISDRFLLHDLKPDLSIPGRMT
jgi:NDP-sugar pyrophosphorylase family protein